MGPAAPCLNPKVFVPCLFFDIGNRNGWQLATRLLRRCDFTLVYYALPILGSSVTNWFGAGATFCTAEVESQRLCQRESESL